MFGGVVGVDLVQAGLAALLYLELFAILHIDALLSRLRGQIGLEFGSN